MARPRLKLPNHVIGFVWRDVRRSVYSFWRHVKNPRKNCGKNKTERDGHDQQFHRPSGHVERRQENRCDLDQQPSDDGISGCNFANIASLQLPKEISRVHGRVTFKSWLASFIKRLWPGSAINLSKLWAAVHSDQECKLRAQRSRQRADDSWR